ncbi:unnamed protein product [Symbiodinium sp. CCMP2592]|nr:unnamed protein product [Symbiodinium sp. CCMP2592]
MLAQCVKHVETFMMPAPAKSVPPRAHSMSPAPAYSAGQSVLVGQWETHSPARASAIEKLHAFAASAQVDLKVSICLHATHGTVGMLPDKRAMLCHKIAEQARPARTAREVIAHGFFNSRRTVVDFAPLGQAGTVLKVMLGVPSALMLQSA